MVLASSDVAVIEIPSPSPARADQQTAIESVISYMRSNLDESHSLDDFAEIAHYSPFHFARLFRQVVGIPPGEFLAALRFERAKHLILETDASITDICFEVGFSSLGTFSARFKHLVGVSPVDLRNLPHRLEPRLHNFQCRGQDSANRKGATLNAMIEAATPASGHLYVGLFPAAIPQSAPVSGSHRFGPGPISLHGIPPGTYRLLAAMYPDSTNPMDHLLRTDRLLVGADPDPVVIVPGAGVRHRSIALRPLMDTDPPILTALAPLALGM
ncbi:MAG TPA: AraC family transcriptional regulator [Thermomicrobiales bacterium]|nr:AraC family transcriptional regulator [Thermomicrobiales bacterium]